MISYKIVEKLFNIDKSWNLPDLEKTIFDYCCLKFEFEKVEEVFQTVIEDIKFFYKEDITLDIDIRYPCVNNTLEIKLTNKEREQSKEQTFFIFPITIIFHPSDFISFNSQTIINKSYSLYNQRSEINQCKPIIKLLYLVQQSFEIKGLLKSVYDIKLYKNIDRSFSKNGFKIDFNNRDLIVKPFNDEFSFNITLNGFDEIISITIDDTTIKLNSNKILQMNLKDFKSIITNLIKLSDYKFKTISDMVDKIHINALIDY